MCLTIFGHIFYAGSIETLGAKSNIIPMCLTIFGHIFYAGSIETLGAKSNSMATDNQVSWFVFW